MNMYMPIDRHAVANQAETRQANKQARSLVPPGKLASRRARSSAAQTCQNESAELHSTSMQMKWNMIDRTRNEQTKGNGTMDWHGDLPWAHHSVDGNRSCSGESACHNNKAQNPQGWQCMRRQTGETFLRELKLQPRNHRT